MSPAGTSRMRPQDWKSGDRLWVVEVIAPFGGADEMVKDLRARVMEAPMIEIDQDFSGALVKPLAGMRGADDEGIDVFCLEIGKDLILFEVAYEYAENGSDFFVRISNFGLRSKFSAGIRSPELLRKFTFAELMSAMNRIEKYFAGSEKKTSLPFNLPNSRFISMKFVDGWAVEK